MDWPLINEQRLYFGIEIILPKPENECVTIEETNRYLYPNPQIIGQRWGSLVRFYPYGFLSLKMSLFEVETVIQAHQKT